MRHGQIFSDFEKKIPTETIQIINMFSISL